MPALTMKETQRPTSTVTGKLEEQIRNRAYELYQARSQENGHDVEDWLRAEIDINSNPTNQHKCKALILDSDPDALMTLQRTLEESGVDTTITWDDTEARDLVGSTPFDVMLIGDHPPEIRAEAAVRDFRRRGASSPCLILRTKARPMSAERLQGLGVVGVLPKRDPARVLEEVKGTCGLTGG